MVVYAKPATKRRAHYCLISAILAFLPFTWSALNLPVEPMFRDMNNIAENELLEWIRRSIKPERTFLAAVTRAMSIYMKAKVGVSLLRLLLDGD